VWFSVGWGTKEGEHWGSQGNKTHCFSHTTRSHAKLNHTKQKLIISPQLNTFYKYFMHGWVGHFRQWQMAKQKLKPYTSHLTWNPLHTCTQTPSHVWEKCFLASPRGTLRVEGPIIKCFVIPSDSKTEKKGCEKMICLMPMVVVLAQWAAVKPIVLPKRHNNSLFLRS